MEYPDSDPADHFPPAARGSPTPSILATTRHRFDLSMQDFLECCHIPPEDPAILKLLKDHQIHHWTAFKNVTKEELKELGFAFGPSQLIIAGILRAHRLFGL
jgi:hypothetical protein